MTLAAGTICFDSLKELKRLQPTIQPYVDYWIIVDGKFTQFEDDHFLSNDKTKEWAKQFDNVIYREVVGWQADKRNEYLKACKKHNIDCLLVIDSDEYVIDADWEAFRKDLARLDISTHFHAVRFVKANGQEGLWPNRLLTHPKDLMYFHAHNVFKTKSGIVRPASNPSETPVTSITITQNDDLRTPEYIKKAYNYQEHMIDHERPIRHKFTK